MYKANILKEELLDLIGWRQNIEDEFQISSELTTSITGQYFQDFHPLLTLDNIKAVAPMFRADYPFWSKIESYKVGEKIKVEDTIYKCIKNCSGEEVSNNEYWVIYDSFSDWLKQKTQSSIVKAVQSFWSEKMSNTPAKSILESKALFDGAGRLSDIINPTNSLVGFEIIPIRAKGVVLKIDKIGLQFDSPIELELMLFHSSQESPVKTFTLNVEKGNTFEWFTPESELLLPYIGNQDAGGSWYLVYKQPEDAKAINRNIDWSASPCSTCNQSNYNNWQIWTKYLEVHPFKTLYSDKLWDISTNAYTYTESYGINLQLSIYCDITDVIIEQKRVFQDLIGLQVASDFLREFAYNPAFRINRTQANFSKSEILYELDGDSTSIKKSGINYMLNKAIKSANLNSENISKICFPCEKRGVKYRTV